MSSSLSHLRDHKFKHNFQDAFNPVSICGKTWKQHLITLLDYHYFTSERGTLLNSIKEIGPINLTKSDSCVINIVLFDNSCLLRK